MTNHAPIKRVGKGTAESPYKFYTFQAQRVAQSLWLIEPEKMYTLSGATQLRAKFSSEDDKSGMISSLVNSLQESYEDGFKAWWCDCRHPRDCWTYGKEKVNPEPHDVWCHTGKQGYWTLQYALDVLKNLRKLNEKRKISNVNYDHQGVSYEFRIVQTTHIKDTWEVQYQSDIL